MRLSQWETMAGVRPPIWSSTPCDMERDAIRYVETYPEIWALFCRFTHEAISAGRSTIGAKLVVERIRWHGYTRAHTDPAKPYVVNNSSTAYLARAFMRAYPEHDGVFRTRVAASDVEAA